MSHRLISRYIVREFVFSFLVAFLFFFFIFFVNQILILAEEIFSKKVPLWDVLLFVLYSLPAIVALAFPFGSLVGSLMAIGRLSSDNEILAMKALGVPQVRLLLPLTVLGVLFSFVSFISNDYFLPLGNIRLAGIYRKILYTNPGVELEPYSVKKYEDTVIVTGNVEGREIRDIVIIDKDAENRKRIISASRAYLAENEKQKEVISLRLENVFSEVASADREPAIEYTASQTMIYNLLLKDISIMVMNPGPREMSSVDVWREIRRKQAELRSRQEEQENHLRRLRYELAMQVRWLQDHGGRSPGELAVGWQKLEQLRSELQAMEHRPIRDRNLQIYKLEFYKKFSFPVSCLIFIGFAFPVGLYTRRSGRTVGFGIGLLMATFYWGLLFTGHTLGVRLEFPPFLAMWLPNLLVLLIALILLANRLKR
jgi:lipopolysaccharide export system permease protein